MSVKEVMVIATPACWKKNLKNSYILKERENGIWFRFLFRINMGNQGLNNVRTQLQKRKQIILRKSGKSTLLHATVFKNWWYSERAQSTYLVCAGNGSRKNVILKATISVKKVMVHYCEYHSGILREEIKYVLKKIGNRGGK